MRRSLSLALTFGIFVVPSLASANPRMLGFAEPPALPPTSGGGAAAPTAPAPTEPAATEPAATEPAATEPAATEPAPSEPAPVEEPQPEEAEVPEDTDPTAEPTLHEERAKHGGKSGFNQHGIGVRSGLTVVPTWIMKGFLTSHTNAMCRSELGSKAEEWGLTRTQGCNWYVGGEYVYRKTRNFDIVAAVGYQRAKLPDGLWLDKDEWADSCTTDDGSAGDKCNLNAADYTEVDMGFLFFEADFIGRGTLVQTPDVEVQMGGGGGIGLGIILGPGVFQTPMGDRAVLDPGARCRTLADFKDFTRCTPSYKDDEDIDQDGDGSQADPPSLDMFDPPRGTDGIGPNGELDVYAECSPTECNKRDLRAFGSRVKNPDVPPVIPVVNLLGTIRIIVKDTVGINITGGWNTGFYMGGSMQFFFGGGGKDV